jgi:UDP-glucose 4-epimerase
MRVVVTGGLGFIGSHLSRRLALEGLEVRILDSAPPEERPLFRILVDGLPVKVVLGDVRSRRDVASALEGADVVVHLAAQIGVRRYVADPVDVADVTYSGTKVVAEEALRRGAALCFVSSSEVYGRNPTVPWDEDADRVTGPPSTTRWVYSNAKALAEHVVHGLAGRGLRFWIIRPFNPYGPGLDPGAFITSSLWRLTHGVPGVLLDGGRQTRCFTYVDDVVAGIACALARPDAQGAAYNIGNPTPVTIAEALDVLVRETGTKVDSRAHEHADGTALFGPGYDEARIRIPRIEKARATLGWEPEVTLGDGVRAMLAWVGRHGWWFDETALG